MARAHPALIDDFLRRNLAWQLKKDQNVKSLWLSKNQTELEQCTFFPETHSYVKDAYSLYPDPLVPFEHSSEAKIVLRGHTFALEQDPGVQAVLQASAQRGPTRSIFKKHPAGESSAPAD